MTIQELAQRVSDSTQLSKKDILRILKDTFKQLSDDKTVIIPEETLTYQISQQ
ncbi:MAG: hypothetical protein Q4A15_02100 [Prevotellaceae bacterium]|nr:hypothetical protein [Prevotellaceae bacterium]